MAYADTGAHKLNPTALGAVFMINGLMAGAIILSVPSVTAAVFGPPIKMFDVPLPSPPPPPTAEKKLDKRIKESSTAVMTPPLAKPRTQQTETGFILPPVIGDIGGAIGSGPGPLETDLTPVPPTPAVLKGAKLDPDFAGSLQPAYPPGMLRLNLEGSVTVRVLVGADGRVKQVEPIKFTEEDFLKATREQAFKKWRFLPATRDGAPVESWREMTVRFQMPIE